MMIKNIFQSGIQVRLKNHPQQQNLPTNENTMVPISDGNSEQLFCTHEGKHNFFEEKKYL